MKADDVSGEIQEMAYFDTAMMMNSDHKRSALVETESFFEPSPEIESVTYHSSVVDSTTSEQYDETVSEYDLDVECQGHGSFLAFRLNFLFVILVVMLADGLQGRRLERREPMLVPRAVFVGIALS